MLITAFVFGFLGSFHCALMCGPLALAGGSSRRATFGYFAGRGLVYALIGAIFGNLGGHAQHRLPIGTLQSGLLLAVAVLAFLKGLRMLVRRERLVRLRRQPRRGAAWLADLLPRRGMALGLVTGLLPCGFLAGAWALAASTGDALAGALVMLVFSLATLPSLAATLLVAARVRWRPTPMVAGVLWCTLGLWIGLRPLFSHAAHGGH
jgi:sulfite exporter TauE/SafE